MSANLAKVVQKLVKPLEERIAALEAKVAELQACTRPAAHSRDEDWPIPVEWINEDASLRAFKNQLVDVQPATKKRKARTKKPATE
jgi:hypothetical protein